LFSLYLCGFIYVTRFAMLVPKGKPVHEHLKTSYVNLAALLADLQVTGFTGYLKLTFPYACGYVFISAGSIMNALDEDIDHSRRGAEAIDAILVRASSPDGSISVYEHREELIMAIAGRIDGLVVYEKLESGFTDLKRLVERLARESDARFYIEAETGQDAECVIYTVDGDINAVVSLANGEIIEGEAGFERILALVAEQDAIYHVYRLSSPRATVSVAPAGAVNVPTNVIAFPEPIPVDDTAHAAELESDTVTDEAVQDEETQAEAAPSSEADYRDDYESLIALMGEVTQVVELAAARLVKDGNFEVALRAGLLEVTDDYPFFDPFAQEFEYQDGKIRFSAAPPPADFVFGLTRALKRAVRELERLVPTIGLRQVIADALGRLEQIRQDDFARFDLSPALAEIVAAE
jgi:hypothetical protein